MHESNAGCALAAPANPRECADLRATSPVQRCLASRREIMRAENLLRRARMIRRRDHACARRRQWIDRSVGDRWHRGVGTERRDARGISDAAGVREYSGIGGTERDAVDRRIAGAGRSRGRGQLRKGLRRHHQAAERQGENQCGIAGHRGRSRRRRITNDDVGRAFPESEGSAVFPRTGTRGNGAAQITLTGWPRPTVMRGGSRVLTNAR